MIIITLELSVASQILDTMGEGIESRICPLGAWGGGMDVSSVVGDKEKQGQFKGSNYKINKFKQF